MPRVFMKIKSNSDKILCYEKVKPYVNVFVPFSQCFSWFLLAFGGWIYVADPQAANEADWMPDANLRTAVRSALDLDAMVIHSPKRIWKT